MALPDQRGTYTADKVLPFHARAQPIGANAAPFTAEATQPKAQPRAPGPETEEYFDIPAFLRKQAEASEYSERQWQKMSTPPNYPPGGRAIDPAPGSPNIAGMSDAITRAEIDAKIALSEVRASAAYQAYASKVDAQVEAIRAQTADFRTEMREEIAAVKADGKTTRATILVTAVATILTVIGLAYSLYQMNLAAQANLLSAFQAGLTAPKPAETPPPALSPQTPDAPKPPTGAPSSGSRG